MDCASHRHNLPLPATDRGAPIAYAAIFGAGALMAWLTEYHVAMMPFWAPWDFSWAVYLGTFLSLFWFLRGLAMAPAAARPPVWRRVAFFIGLGLIYAVLQTRFEYLSQHMFFLNRTQHVVMHHLGPLLIALGCSGATIKRGMPSWLARAIESPFVTVPLRLLQQPLLAATLFVGSFYFWLIPDVHFRAMIDPRLYALMNWSMVLDGILFWALVLDPRPKPPARVSYGTRVALAFGVMFPQIVLGAIITFAQRDLYPYYALCGRLYPSITAISDQHIGGIIIWIPPSMMSVIAGLLVINALRIHEDSIEEKEENASSMATLAKSWTGR